MATTTIPTVPLSRKRISINVHGIIDGKPYRRCPCCGELKELNEFGLRILRGVVANQSWCRSCR